MASKDTETVPVTEREYIPCLWCVYVHYLGNGLLGFHTCWSYHVALLYQTRFWNRNLCSRFDCSQLCQFLLWTGRSCHQLRWTLLCCSETVRRPVNQSASSTCYDPVRWRGIARQRSVSTESWRVCWWRWTWSDDRSLYQDRSWRRACSSRSVTWSLVNQARSFLRAG